jgi:hypothetical protein
MLESSRPVSRPRARVRGSFRICCCLLLGACLLIGACEDDHRVRKDAASPERVGPPVSSESLTTPETPTEAELPIDLDPTDAEPATPAENEAMTNALSLHFISEMERFAEEFGQPVPTMTEADLAVFETAWAAAQPRVTEAVTPAKLADLSRWAKEQTRGAVLPADWATNLRLEPKGVSADGTRVLFSTTRDTAPPLPSHSPLVHRQLILAAVFNTSTQCITDVYVTIQGWVEE